MRLSAKTFAAMLIGLALAAFQPDLDAQSRGGSRSSSASASRPSGSSTSRPSGSSDKKTVKPSAPASKPSGSASTRPSGTASKPSGSASVRPSGTTAKPSGSTSSRPAGQSSSSVSKPSSRPQADISPADRNPSRPSGNKPSGTNPGKPSVNKPQPDKPAPDRPSGNRPSAGPDRPKPGSPKPDFKPGNHNKPISVRPPQRKPDRLHPRDRDFMHYSKPAYHWTVTPHYYGYRVRTLPINVVKHIYGGVTYYYYDNIWYRPFNGYYIISRPPFGTSLAASLIADAAWTAVKLSYYNTVANTYNQISENNAYIAQQNAQIAQNNAMIAAQNQQIAQSQTKAQAAYSLANELGLIQSYAAANSEYYYQDGVFYSMATDGQYYVIVPPAGALVESLPEDFDTVILNGKEYFKVDNTVYQMTISDGKPYFEVLGQMN